jgi:hypothetical protein
MKAVRGEDCYFPISRASIRPNNKWGSQREKPESLETNESGYGVSKWKDSENKNPVNPGNLANPVHLLDRITG